MLLDSRDIRVAGCGSTEQYPRVGRVSSYDPANISLDALLSSKRTQLTDHRATTGRHEHISTHTSGPLAPILQ